MTLRQVRKLGDTASARAERQMILLSASVAQRRSELSGWADRNLVANLDWEQLTATLGVRRLLPTLGPRILELGGQHSSESFGLAVEQAVEVGRRQGTLLQLACTRVIDALAHAGIASVALKGPSLAEALYGDVGRRLSNDVDVLVPAEHLHAAVEVVRELGYASPADYVDDSGLPMVHFALIHQRSELPAVELHWRTHWYEPHFARDRLLPPSGTPDPKWRPAPVDELVSLLLFYARDGFVDLRLATDIGTWWDAFGVEIPRGATDETIRNYPALARAIGVALKVAETTVGLPLAEIVEQPTKLKLRDHMAMRLADPNPNARRSQLYADMGLIDGLLTPAGGFRAFAKRQLLLPREVFDERAGATPGWRAKSPLGYGARTLARYALATGRMLRTPEALP